MKFVIILIFTVIAAEGLQMTLVKLGLRLSQLIDLVSEMSQCLVNASKISPMAPSTLLKRH